MKIPHALFRLINRVMLMLLRSPLHRLFSSSILAIRYEGRKSGRTLTVPARYLERDDEVVLTTSQDTKWWPNFQEPNNAEVLLKGQWKKAQVHAIRNDPDLAISTMQALWAKHPSDAAYMSVKIRNGEPDPEDIARAALTAVVVRITLKD